MAARKPKKSSGKSTKTSKIESSVNELPRVRKNVGARNLRAIAARKVLSQELPGLKPNIIAIRKRFNELISTPNLYDLMKKAYPGKMKETDIYEKQFDPMHGSLVYSGLHEATKRLAERSNAGMYEEYLGFFKKYPPKGTAAMPDICPDPTARSDSQSSQVHGLKTERVNASNKRNAGYEFNDPVQGCLLDCWLIAAFSSYAWASTYGTFSSSGNAYSPALITSLKVKDYTSNKRVPITTSSAFYLDNNSQYPYYSRTNLNMLEQTAYECWPCLYEKLFALYYEKKTTPFKTDDPPKYEGLNGGSAYTALTEFTLMVSTVILTASYLGTPPDADVSGMIYLIKSNVCPDSTTLDNGRLFYYAQRPTVADTYFSADPSSNYVPAAANDPSYTPKTVTYNCPGISANHTYSVLGLYEDDSDTYIVLRNPWGYDGNPGAFTPDLVNSVSTSLTNLPEPANIADPGSEGIFGLKMITFMRYFEKLGWI